MTAASHPFTITLHAGFFLSEFVPEICVFSGATDRLERRPIHVHHPGDLDFHRGRPLGSGEWQATFEPWVRPSAYRRWQWRRRVGDYGLLAGIVLGLLAVTLLYVQYGDAKETHAMNGWWEFLAVSAVVVTGLLTVAWRARRQPIRFEALTTRHQITIHFAAELEPVYEIYRAAWDSFVEAGCPMPEHFAEADEGWEDRNIGFDQAGGVRP